VSPEVIDALVRLVANGRKFRVDDAIVIEHLIEMGVPKEHAADLLTEIGQGLQRGNDLATNGTGEPPVSPPASPLYLAAFTAGQQAVADERKAQRLRQVVMVFIGLVVISVMIYIAAR
jgi:hypothetical protein